MWRFVLHENVERYRRLLATEKDGERRRVLQRLVDADERELAELNAASMRAHAAHNAEIASLLQNLLDGAIKTSGADLGIIQIFDTETQSLLIGAQRNFRRPFLDHFAVVAAGDGSSCGRALADKCPVRLEDIADAPSYAAERDVAHDAGFRAVQSIPLVEAGLFIGMLSTHFRAPRAWSAEEQAKSDADAQDVAKLLSVRLTLSALR